MKQELEAVSYLRVAQPLLKEKEGELKSLEKEMLFAALRPRETENKDGLPLWPAGMVLLAGCIGLVYEALVAPCFPGLSYFYSFRDFCGILFKSY